MTFFAPVGPIQILEGLHAAGTLGNYHLLLAHHTLEHKARFTDLFARLDGSTDEDITVIMDNSIVELGASASFDAVAEATQCIVNASSRITVIPVLPDVMGKGKDTRDAVEEAYPLWAREMPGDGLMAVAQGDSFDDYMASLAMFTNIKNFPGITWIGVPRFLHKTCGSRVPAAMEVSKYAHTHRVHLLGFCDDVRDDLGAAAIPGITGIDSAVPLRVREAFTELVDAGARAPDWFDKAQVDSLMLANLNSCRRMFA